MVTAVICIAIITFNFKDKEKISGKVRIGVSDDTSGFVIDYMKSKDNFKNLQLVNNLDTYTVADCCSSTTQWALSSDEIDLAIICKEAAKEFIENDNDFVVVSPVLKNSDIFLINNRNIDKIGVTNKRNYQYDLVRKYYKNAEIVPITGTALGYALESKQVDGAVMDIFRALSLEGEKLSTASNGEYESYVLVSSKEFMKSKEYKSFITLYNKAVKELQDEKTFKKELKNYKNIDVTIKEMEDMKSWKIKFLQIKEDF
jgi:ABC-type amino acid transport substrate-binding protein